MKVQNINSQKFNGRNVINKTADNLSSKITYPSISPIFSEFQDRFMTEQKLKLQIPQPKSFMEKIGFVIENIASKF